MVRRNDLALNKKDASRLGWRSIAAIAGYVVLFLVTRLLYISEFPLHVDEISHIFLAKLTLEGDLFVGMRETGKQLYVWLVAIALRVLGDPIMAGRGVSVLVGLMTGGICYKLTTLLYPQRRLAYLAALFYLVGPFAVMFDRMALTDSALTMLMGSGLLASWQLWRHGSLRWAFLTGVLFGLAAWIKGYALLFYPAPIFLGFFLGQRTSRTKTLGLLAVTYGTTLLAWLFVFSLGWQTYRRELLEKSVIGRGDVLFLVRFWQNSHLIGEWLTSYLTWPIVILLIYTTVRMLATRDSSGFVLIAVVGGSLLIFASAFTVLFSRYLLPLFVPISVMVAWGIDDLSRFLYARLQRISPRLFAAAPSRLIIQIMIFLIICIPALSFSYLIVTRPAQAPFPEKDKHIYITLAQAAHGYREIAQLIEELAQRHRKLIFLRHALPDPFEVLMRMYISEDVLARIDLVEIRDFDQVRPESLNSYANQAPTLTVDNELITASHNELGSLAYAQLWPVASFAGPNRLSNKALYQWLLPAEFAVHWFQQGGDPEPTIAGDIADHPFTAPANNFMEWPQASAETAAGMQQALAGTNIEYVLVTPALVNRQSALFKPFITTDGTRLRLEQLPPGWRLAFAYPDLNCRWCLFQLRPPDHPTQITFGESIVLEGYDLALSEFSADEKIHLTLYWRTVSTVPESIVVFVHLLDPAGKLVNQIDEPPFQGKWPTNRWPVGTRVADRHILTLDPDMPAGEYTISVGLYTPSNLARLPTHSNQETIVDNAVHLTSIPLGRHSGRLK